MGASTSLVLQNRFEQVSAIQNAQLVMGRYENLPSIDKALWEDDPEAFKKLNCYSFGVDVPISKYTMASEGKFIDRLRPGEIDLRRKFREMENCLEAKLELFNVVQTFARRRELSKYAELIVSGAVHDGLQYTADRLVATPDSFPSALFFFDGGTEFENNFHFCTLRQDKARQPVWVDKSPAQGVHILGRTENMFRHALNNGYDVFGGYFLRPETLDA